MNRRRFVRLTGIAAASAGVAGCARPGDGGDDAADAAGDDAADAAGDDDGDVSVTLVRNAPENPGPYEDPASGATAQESDALAVDGLTFQRAGEKGLVVAGDAVNVGDRAFASVTVGVTLYDENETEDEIFDSASVETDHGRLDAGETWQWAATFDEEPEFDIDYYTVQAAASYA